MTKFPRFARSLRQGILGTILLIILIPASCVLLDERLSRGLDEVDITWEELQDARNARK